MRYLIVELQLFNYDNEKLKKVQEDQKKINEILLHSIEKKKIPRNNEMEEEVSKNSSKNSSHETERANNYFKDTHMKKKVRIYRKEEKTIG